MNNGNLREIAQAIYQKPCGEANSVQLQLDEETYNESGKYIVFEILYLITYYGIEILYGDVKIIDLTKDQFDNVKGYVRSYGYDIIVLGDDNLDPWQLKRLGRNVNKINVYFDRLK